jgi:hypothetical protein
MTLRHPLSRAVAFGVAGAAALAIAQIGDFFLNPRTLTSPIEIVVIRHFEAVAVAGLVLTLGAWVGFAAAGERLASAKQALALGAIAGIPATLLASTFVGSLGGPGAVAVAAFLAAMVAYLGGGGLRSPG